MKRLFEKEMEALKVDGIDDETIRMTERIVQSRISTKHINLWMRNWR